MEGASELSKHSELNQLKAERDKLQIVEKQALDEYNILIRKAESAHLDLRSAEQDYETKRQHLHRIQTMRQSAKKANPKVWQNYLTIKQHNNRILKVLKKQSKKECRLMHEYFEQAHNSYRSGKRILAGALSLEAREHQDRKLRLDNEIEDIIFEIQLASEKVDELTPGMSRSVELEAERELQAAKSRVQELTEHFTRLKEERNIAKIYFEDAHTDYKRAEANFKKQLEASRKKNLRKYFYRSK